MNVVREWKWYGKLYRRFVYYFRRKRRFVRETELGKICSDVWCGKYSILDTLIWKCTTMLRAMRIAANEAECYVRLTGDPTIDENIKKWMGTKSHFGEWNVPPDKIASKPDGAVLLGTRIKYHTLWAFRKKLKEYFELDEFKMTYEDYRKNEQFLIKELVGNWLANSGNWLD